MPARVTKDGQGRQLFRRSEAGDGVCSLRIEIVGGICEHHLAGDARMRLERLLENRMAKHDDAEIPVPPDEQFAPSCCTHQRCDVCCAGDNRSALVEDGQHVAPPPAFAGLVRNLGCVHRVDARLGSRQRQPGERIEEVVPVVRTGLYLPRLEEVNFVVRIGRAGRHEADWFAAFGQDVRFLRQPIETVEGKIFQPSETGPDGIENRMF
jgi:hypothetical protein